MNRLTVKAALVVFDAVAWAYRAPILGAFLDRAGDIVLDTILGPVEDLDYVSTTAPSSPPPPRL